MKRIMSDHIRIIVKLQKQQDVPKVAKFSDSVLDYFGFPSGIGRVHLQVKDNFLILSDTEMTANDSVSIKRPEFCPVHNMTEEMLKSLPEDTASRGIDVGASIILESSDGKILLSRRAKHLRIFPGIWVPPGGHMEADETLIETGLRELREETGLHLRPSDCVDEKIHLLALWESVYPPKLFIGPPKRHHIVVYFHARLVNGLTADMMEDHIKFDPGEVDACAWLDREVVKAIAYADEDCSETTNTSHLPKAIRAFILDENSEQQVAELPSAPLFKPMSDEEPKAERVSTGTKFALQEFLKVAN